MDKQIKCPKCGEDSITLWMKGVQGYPVSLDRRGEIKDEIMEATATPEYNEMSFETFSCSCGYETQDEQDVIAPKEKMGCCMTETEMRETFENEWVHCPWCGKKIDSDISDSL